METTETKFQPITVVLPLLVGLLSLAVFASGYATYTAWIFAGLSVCFFVLSGYSRWFWMVLGFSAACSVDLPFAGGVMVNFPAEPVTACLLLRFFMEGITGKVSSKIFSHPLSILLLLYLFWVAVAAGFSVMPAVSIKQVIVKTTYAAVYYFLLLHELQKNKLTPRSISIAFAAGFVPVVLFIWWNHSHFGFTKDASGFASRPFFHDHTQYSAVICLLLPFFTFRKKNEAILLLFLLAALYFSFSRAAYVSLLLAAALRLFYVLGFTNRQLLMLLVFLGCAAAWKSDELLGAFRMNKNDSNARNAGIAEQAKSITNITTDQSNAERLNRWNCALRMAKEKPFVGFGPGTYQFTYLPFQRSREMTRISVKNPNNHEDGRGGTAHNEYLLALSECGIPAALLYFLLCVIAIKTAFFKRNNVAAGMAVSTYFLHGFFNNFLDTPAVAFLFFAWLAIIAHVDRLSSRENALQK